MKLRNFLLNVPLEKIILQIVASICLTASIFLFTTKIGYDVLGYVTVINVPAYLSTVVSVYFVINILDSLIKGVNIPAWAMAFSVLVYAVLTALRQDDFFFALGILIVLCFVGYYLLKDDKLKLSQLKPSQKFTRNCVIVLGLLFTIYIGGMCTFRYLSYNAPNFDFGIFTQMFNSMKETGLPTVSCERDKVLSHFAVHVSPIFYLLLPGYYVFSSPVYLEIAQAVILASGLIPLYLLSRHFKLGEKSILMISIAYSMFPALAGGCFYDLHENKFLTPILLWLFWFLEKERWLGVYICAFLTLMVKEDAAIYVACIALFLFFCRKKFLHGSIIFTCSMSYFAVIIAILNKYGDGAMIGRYDNYISDPKAGLLSIVKTLFINPVYLVEQVFTKDKMIFLLLMLLPVAMIPLISKKLSQLILLIPMLVVNLMSNYSYQHSIRFQYTYGVIAILFYLTVLNLPEIRDSLKKYLLPFMATAAVIFSMGQIKGQAQYLPIYIKNYGTIQTIDSALEIIPKDASVRASAFLIPHLYEHEILYRDDSENFTEYIAFDFRPGYRENYAIELIEKYINEGYEVVAAKQEAIVILYKAQ